MGDFVNFVFTDCTSAQGNGVSQLSLRYTWQKKGLLQSRMRLFLSCNNNIPGRAELNRIKAENQYLWKRYLERSSVEATTILV